MSSTHPKHGVDPVDRDSLANVLPGSGEYRFEEGTSSKYWRVEPLLSRDPFGDYKITWGRIGTAGQSQVVPRATAAKRIREKVAKGYRLAWDYVADAEKHQRRQAQERVATKREERQTATNFLEELFKIS